MYLGYDKILKQYWRLAERFSRHHVYLLDGRVHNLEHSVNHLLQFVEDNPRIAAKDSQRLQQRAEAVLDALEEVKEKYRSYWEAPLV